MSLSLQASSKGKESPVDVVGLEKILEGELDKLSEPQLFIEAVASTLHKKSTKHKFIVLVTQVDADANINENLSIKSAVGTVWDTEKDGYHLFKVEAESTFMVTVFWVYVG